MLTPLIEAAFPVPGPSWRFGQGVAVAYVVILLGIGMAVPLTVIDPRAAPVTALIGIPFYGFFAWARDQRDPRLWRDREVFDAYVTAWIEQWQLDPPSDDERQRLRAISWSDQSVSIALQAGMTAGAGAGITFVDHGWPLAFGVFFGTMLAVGVGVNRWLMAPDRLTLGPLLDAGGHGTPPG